MQIHKQGLSQTPPYFPFPPPIYQTKTNLALNILIVKSSQHSSECATHPPQVINAINN